MEVLWKAISGIINFQLSSSIQFHDFLHVFCAGRGTGTATLEVKLIQKLTVMRETVLHVILINLSKAYDALDREQCLDILVGYGVGPRTIRILQIYWERLHMEENAGGNYGTAFQRHCRVTKGVPLSPTIFNVVVDAVIRHWGTVVGVTHEGVGQEGLGTSIQALSKLFHTNDGIVALPERIRPQGVFDDLTGLFDRVGLRINDGKKVRMACSQCHTPHTWSTGAYTRQMMVRGILYRDWLRQRVQCPECGFDLAAGSLTPHRQRQHGFGRSKSTPHPPLRGGGRGGRS